MSISASPYFSGYANPHELKQIQSAAEMITSRNPKVIDGNLTSKSQVVKEHAIDPALCFSLKGGLSLWNMLNGNFNISPQAFSQVGDLIQDLKKMGSTLKQRPAGNYFVYLLMKTKKEEAQGFKNILKETQGFYWNKHALPSKELKSAVDTIQFQDYEQIPNNPEQFILKYKLNRQ